jgi:transposase
MFIVLDVQRLECSACGAIRQAAIRFADPRVSYIRAFERYVIDLLGMATIDDVARHVGLAWDVVKDIQKRHLKRKYSKPNLAGLKRLAIDEIAVAKGHRYLTVVMDLTTGAVVFVGDGKGADALDPFWLQMRVTRFNIEAVATDMSAAYVSAVRNHLPNAKLVLDHFHVVKSMNEKLSNIRRDLYRDALVEDKKILKGTRWLLLKNPENLDAKRNEKARLEEALSINKPLAIAYYLKEDLRSIWSAETKKVAGKNLTAWINKAKASKINRLVKFAETLRTHRKAILAYYDFPISTGPLEGMNNKIKTMKRQAYGFRDMEFFKLRIKALHEAKHVLVG